MATARLGATYGLIFYGSISYDVSGCRSAWFGLDTLLDPRGVLAAGLKLDPLRIDAARGLVRAGLQLSRPARAG
jgi:hypothetical protein